VGGVLGVIGFWGLVFEVPFHQTTTCRCSILHFHACSIVEVVCGESHTGHAYSAQLFGPRYKKGSGAKGRNVFLADIEPFIKWLDEAEEEEGDEE
jgi:hypothetical protein